MSAYLVTGAQVIYEGDEPVDLNEIIIGVFSNYKAAQDSGEIFRDKGVCEAFVVKEIEISDNVIEPTNDDYLVPIFPIIQ